MRNGGEWSESKFQSFIKSALRSASQRWPPKYAVLKDAFVGVEVNTKTGRKAKHYKCSYCGCHTPSSNCVVDHINPVVPVTGFISWDNVIENLFCEKEGLQVLCKECHAVKTKEENALRKANTKNNNKV